MLDTPKTKNKQTSQIGDFSDVLTDVALEPVPPHLESLAVQLGDALKQRLKQKEPA